LNGRRTKTNTRRLKSTKEFPSPRVGIGYDIHAFGPGRKFLLGGVTIPHEDGLVGHSDADVLLHAICDALLGAAALGDIGKHFPNTSSKYKGISSLLLLEHVGRLLSKRNFRIVNVDATIILERPRILRYSAAMAKNISASLCIETAQVSIKATTNEGLGFIGRGEGCAAIAVVSIISSLL
jgi:2-C-methyl-D-erythritol 2,4-cyclodiphosphate synthase